MSRRDTFKRVKLSHKVCDTCGQDLDIKQFRIMWNNPDGTKRKIPYEPNCRACRSKLIKEALREAGYKVEGTDDELYNVY